MYMYEDKIEYIVAKNLCEKNLTISTAESCTGGMIAAKLIDYPGISAIFLEGAVTYSNEAKVRRLDVNQETLDTYGAVSEETAKEMVQGIAKTSGSNVAIATTGIAGPGGGSLEKPVGLVYIGVYINGLVKVDKCNFNGNRKEVREAATEYALNMLNKHLKVIEIN